MSIRKKFNKHITIAMVLQNVVTMFLLVGLVYLGQIVVEAIEPANWTFEYHSVTPTEESWLFASYLTRHKNAEFYREDTPYCMVGSQTEKLQTQRWPVDGTEYKWKGTTLSAWRYALPVPEIATTCRMCGTVTAITPTGWKKRWNYCTDWFSV